MKLGIMQPYFFPYVGYFQLIHAVDRYIFFDTTQYEKKGRWMNRNRIFNIKEGSTYITVPVENAPLGTALKDTKIDDSKDWRGQILAQLDIYRKRAPFYTEVINLVKEVFTYSGSNLSQLNINAIIAVCEYLSLPFDYNIFSEMDLEIPKESKKDEWALNITKALGYTEYINSPGGKTFYSKDKFSEHGITLQFLEPELKQYEQKIGRYEPGLSIIDVLMFNNIKETNAMLESYNFA